MKNEETRQQVVRIPNSVWNRWTELKKHYSTVVNGVEVNISDSKLLELIIGNYKEKVNEQD